MRLAWLMIFVPDLAAARQFYSGVLGLPVKAEEENRLIFALDDLDLVAFLCSEGSAPGRYSEVAGAAFVLEVPSGAQRRGYSEVIRCRGCRRHGAGG